ncbi:hypothetical protein Moror_11767 [Moniliophthora roreri MCA 2997]|uniref:Uncharacterized protein n=2 Tax=Moniliophthora roreri TaxID=221103 RepID=V2XUA5_MONRO|nr:hypothetical protein Moror_11767 [Moniliophthora roreri MCA 2997]KAI3598559.1 hypothetical protein WG66_017080 [Moniliophthora roreri]
MESLSNLPPSSPRNAKAKGKNVAWCTITQVFVADDWDRTPVEPCRCLSFSEMLELKALLRMLPSSSSPTPILSVSALLSKSLPDSRRLERTRKCADANRCIAQLLIAESDALESSESEAEVSESDASSSSSGWVSSSNSETDEDGHKMLANSVSLPREEERNVVYINGEEIEL